MDVQIFNNLYLMSAYLKEFGFLAPFIAFGLFVLQAALPIFPYIILAAAGGLLFGWKMGFLLSWLGALAGACVAYWICRYAGSDWAKNVIKKRFNYDIDKIDSGLAFWSILIARIIPVIPTPAINAAAALTGVSFWNFFVSSALGKIPTAILYTGLGISIFKYQDIKLTLIILGLIIALAAVGHYYSRRKSFSH
ncbi:MAG TPA: TVP38/TMEM64 family protein [Syntrophomonadaceae bacterium]|nr:TVP38/TMEM64 family protein [Syntrophomonadaceae bacterium]HPR93405.1 TVP38/TMEM64 family protein [Syntrophomonadaceae bacterium]